MWDDCWTIEWSGNTYLHTNKSNVIIFSLNLYSKAIGTNMLNFRPKLCIIRHIILYCRTGIFRTRIFSCVIPKMKISRSAISTFSVLFALYHWWYFIFTTVYFWKSRKTRKYKGSEKKPRSTVWHIFQGQISL